MSDLYTRKIAAEIVDVFEDLLDQHNLTIPDDDRTGNEGEAPIYGPTYGNLLDDVERIVLDVVDKVRNEPDVMLHPYEFE